MVRKDIYYFEKRGISNTQDVLRVSDQRARDLGIKTVVIATDTGETAFLAHEIMSRDLQIIAVSGPHGYKPRTEPLMPQETVARLNEMGIPLVGAAHAFAGINRAITRMWGGITPVQILAQTFKIFGEGMKACVEISLMASDAGYVPMDQEIIAIAGTSRGADTAVVVRPAYSHEFFDLRVPEIICLPRIRSEKWIPI